MVRMGLICLKRCRACVERRIAVPPDRDCDDRGGITYAACILLSYIVQLPGSFVIVYSGLL